MQTHTPLTKRLNATLPDSLAQFVGEMTGDGGLYETPSEFVRDLIRRDMEKRADSQRQEINSLLRQALAENHYIKTGKKIGKKILASLR